MADDEDKKLPELPGWTEKAFVWVAILAILIPIIAMHLEKNRAGIELFFRYLFLTILLLSAVGLGAFFLWSANKRSSETAAKQAEDDKDLAEYVATLKLKAAEYRKLYDAASRPFEDIRQVLDAWLIEIEAEASVHNLPFNRDLRSRMETIGEFVLLGDDPRKFVPPKPFAEYHTWGDYDREIATLHPLADKAYCFEYYHITDRLTISMVAFLKALPAPTATSSPWTLPATELIDVRRTIVQMLEPFCTDGLKEENLCASIRKKYGEGHGATGAWPLQYQGDDILDVYLEKPFKELFEYQIPYQPFTDEERFSHHWCKGAYGAGKTTFLSHLIKHDLDRVAKDECSLIVMDSKKLVREMRTLKLFSPGGPLNRKVTIIDAERPFPLNPLRLPKAQAVDTLSYGLAGIMEATDLQSDDIAHVAAAAYSIPDATLDTIRDFFVEVPKGTIPFSQFKSRFDEDTLFYLEHVFVKLPANTKQGILRRIMGLRKSEVIRDMFNADSCIDLFEELHEGGKVLLVDANTADLGEDGTHVLGRLIICMVEQLSVRRTKLDEASLKPIWFIIDEAHDYIHSDPRFAKILEKARAQKIGVTVAHHHDQQIDKRIEASLAQAGFRSACERRGEVSVVPRGKPPLTLSVKRYSFIKDELHMSRPEYDRLRDTQEAAYPYKKTKPSAEVGDEPEPPTQKF